MAIDRSQLVTKEDKDRAESDREIRNKAHEALAYLRETDWYVVRSMETGKPVPEDVATTRAQARADIDLAETLPKEAE